MDLLYTNRMHVSLQCFVNVKSDKMTNVVLSFSYYMTSLLVKFSYSQLACEWKDSAIITVCVLVLMIWITVQTLQFLL